MNKYNKPVLEIIGYKLTKTDICVSDIVKTENIDWTINGLKNALQK